MTEDFMEIPKRIAAATIKFLEDAGGKPSFHILATIEPDSIMEKIFPGMQCMTLGELRKKHLSPYELRNASEYRDLPLWLELLARAKDGSGDFVFCIPWNAALSSITNLSNPCRDLRFTERVAFLSRTYVAHSAKDNAYMWIRNHELPVGEIIPIEVGEP